MGNQITKQISDELLEQLLISAWELGFNTSTESCNGEFPGGLGNECRDDVKDLIAKLQGGNVSLES